MPGGNNNTYIPSLSIRQRITGMEGAAMNGATIDPNSHKLAKKNNSFDNEARLFYSALPQNIRDRVLSNQLLADNLFSYSYNVGSGNFKSRVVPALEAYYSGRGSINTVLDSMYGKGDSKLRGLSNRRQIEREAVRDALITTIPKPVVNFYQQPDATRVARPAVAMPVHRREDGGSLDTPKQWEDLSLSEKNDVMAAAVRNGITNLHDIRQKWNEFADGGSMDNGITENKEAVAAAKEKYPMLRGIDFSVYSDPNYRASDYDGYGDIEVFHKGEQKVDYTPEYSYPNPNINQDNVLYNPNRIPERYTQDAINLDAISHLGHNDPTYDTLNAAIGSEYPDAATNEMLPLYEKMTGKNLIKMPDSKKPLKKEWIPQVLKAWDDAPQRYQNAIDGLVRDYIISKEHPDPNDPIYKGLDYVKYNPQWDSENNSPFYLNQLYDYITTGMRPANILPEVTVTGHKHAVGGKVAHDARYNHATQIYQSYINQGVNPQTALELTNQKIAEKGWTGWVSGDNKRYNNVNSFTDHTIDQFNRLYPDSLKSNNFNQFFQGIEGGKTKYNPTPGIYRQHLLQTRPGVKKRINEYRQTKGLSPLTLQSTTPIMPWDNNILVNPVQQQLMQSQPLQGNIAAYGGNLYAKGGKINQVNQRARQAVGYFMNKGLSKVAASGLVGNLMRESNGLDINAVNPHGGAYGLAQWLGPRQKELFRRYGSHPTFENQLDYIWSELNTTHKKGLQMLMASKTADEAARNAFGYYEFSRGPKAAIASMNKNGKKTKWKNPDGYSAMMKGVNNARQLLGESPLPYQSSDYSPSYSPSNSPSFGNMLYTPMSRPLSFEDAMERPSLHIEVPKVVLPMEEESKPEQEPVMSPMDKVDHFNALMSMLGMKSPLPSLNPYNMLGLSSNTSSSDNSLFNMLSLLGGNTFGEGGKKNNVKDNTIVHPFTWDKPFTYNGRQYPTSEFIDDRTGKTAHAFADSEGNIFDIINNKPVPATFVHDLPEVTVDYKMKPIDIAKDTKDYLTQSNDATSYADGREQNLNLADRANRGTAQHAAWEQDHPTLTKWSYVPSLATFAVTSAPFIVGGADTIAGTEAGQAISGPLVDMAMQMGRRSWMPWVDAVTMSIFGADGMNDVRNGNITPETVLELAPLTRVGKGLVQETAKGVEAATNYLDRNMGYYGDNLVSRTYGTVSRRYDLPTTSQIPEAYRALNTIPNMTETTSSPSQLSVQDAAEQGRQAFLNYVQSPWYRERLLNQGISKENVDKVLNEIYMKAKYAPFNFSKTIKQLDHSYGVTETKPKFELMTPNLKVTNYDTGLNPIMIALDNPDAKETAFHELLHYTTANVNKTISSKFLKDTKSLFTPNTYDFSNPVTGQKEYIMTGGKKWQHNIVEQNDDLLPQQSEYWKMIMEDESKAKNWLIKNGISTPQKASRDVKLLQNYAKYMWDVQEQRAHLQTWFANKVLPNIKNPNDANEIEQYFISNPDILEKAPDNVKKVMNELRHGSIKQYAKYFSKALGSLPIINYLINDSDE